MKRDGFSSTKNYKHSWNVHVSCIMLMSNQWSSRGINTQLITPSYLLASWFYVEVSTWAAWLQLRMQCGQLTHAYESCAMYAQVHEQKWKWKSLFWDWYILSYFTKCQSRLKLDRTVASAWPLLEMKFILFGNDKISPGRVLYDGWMDGCAGFLLLLEFTSPGSTKRSGYRQNCWKYEVLKKMNINVLLSDWWIGLRWHEGQFVWQTTWESMSWTDWKDGHPGSNPQHCVKLKDGRWDAKRCDENHLALCENWSSEYYDNSD